MSGQFVVLVPVKSVARAKTRLIGVSESARRKLAVAFALDSICAAIATPGIAEVLAVGDDPEIAEAARLLGCRALPDHGNLNASLSAAATERRTRSHGTVLVALCADLPGLTPADLESALASLPPDRPGFVSDHAGIGTTTYAARPEQFDPRFGPRSRAAHLGAGARELTTASIGLRHDVDTLEDLRELTSLGVLGPHTSACEAVIDLRAELAR